MVFVPFSFANLIWFGNSRSIFTMTTYARMKWIKKELVLVETTENGAYVKQLSVCVFKWQLTVDSARALILYYFMIQCVFFFLLLLFHIYTIFIYFDTILVSLLLHKTKIPLHLFSTLFFVQRVYTESILLV